MTARLQPDASASTAALVAQLAAILPPPSEAVRLALATPGGGTMRSTFFATQADAAREALVQDAAGATVYLATAAFAPGDDGRHRYRDRAHLAPLCRKSLHLDIDVGPGKDYGDVHTAARALYEFTFAAGMRAGQTLVSSGHGLHVYWALEAATDYPAWLRVASKLAELADRLGLRVDGQCTADAVRLLRPVGTHNRKTAGPSEPMVRVVAHECRAVGSGASGRPVRWPTIPLEVLERTIEDALQRAPHPGGLGPMVPRGASAGGLPANTDLTAFPARKESPDNVEWVRARLASIDPSCSRETWRAVVWAVASTGWTCAIDLAKAWSAESAKFDEGEFAKLWSSYRPEAGGPTLGTLDHLAQANGFKAAKAVTSGGLPAGTDAWHAQRFATGLAGRLAYVHGSGRWVAWTGHAWRWCDQQEQVREAMAYGRAVLKDAHDAESRLGPTHPGAVQLHKTAARMSSAKAIAAMLSLAQALPEVSIADAGAFDANPWLLGVSNGVIDLRSGALLAPDPSMLVMRQCGAAFNRDADCPSWRRFVGEVFFDDLETIDYVQRMLGYCLTGDVNEEVLHFCHGFGANGKSVFANVVAQVLGSYVYHAQWGLLVHDARDTGKGPNPDVARMAGARLVYVNETEQGARLSETAMKALVSTEPVTVRELYGSPFTFKPTAKLLVRGNHKPIVTGTDNGVWRRLRLLPFTRQFDGSQRDNGLTALLLSEADGILQWMLAGLAAWRTRGLAPSGAVARASAEYRRDMDLVGQWLAERCSTESPDAASSVAAAYASYTMHCQQAGMRANSQNSLTRELEQRGITRAQRTLRGERTRVYVGLRVLDDRSLPAN